MEGLEIVQIEKEHLEDRMTIFVYSSDWHYKVSILEREDGWSLDLKKTKFPHTFVKHDETDKFIQPYKGESEIYLAFIDGIEAGQLQIELQPFSKSLRVWDIDIWPDFKRRGIGQAFMELCGRRATELDARRIVLEVQSSNSKAIAFYKAMGFKLIGMDASCYRNDDVERGEVRLEMAIHL
ncbi:MAG: GNAT family N-acetyltransferase [Thermoplasmata archaeon]|nr:GNAT family N-acetyltransferase [Thermoplasmata archaeon]